MSKAPTTCSECGGVTLQGEPPIHNRNCPAKFARPAEEDERRALRWLMDQRENGGPLDRCYAATVLGTLAWFEQEAPVDTRP